MHDLYLVVWEQIRRCPLREPARIFGFIRTILHRRIANEIENRTRARRECEEQLLFLRPSLETRPDEHAERSELKGVVTAALSDLPALERTILRRYYLDEDKELQIRADLALTENQFRLRKSRGKAKFGEAARQRLKPTLRKAMAKAA